MRQRNITRSEIPFNDPILQAKTLSQINSAFDFLESSPRNPLETYYEKLMGEDDVYSTTPTSQICKTEWTPISELRWKPLSCSHITRGATMMIFTPVDLFTIMWCRIELERSIRFFYGTQSLLSREKADYYLAYTANKTARKQNYRLRNLGDHKIATGLPVILSSNASFSGRQKRIFENLNPLPALQPIPSEQGEFHDFVVQVMTHHGTRNSRKPILYEGREFSDVTLSENIPLPTVSWDSPVSPPAPVNQEQEDPSPDPSELEEVEAGYEDAAREARLAHISDVAEDRERMRLRDMEDPPF